MASKFHKNAILTGNIDSFCLVCESYLRSEDDIHSHMAKPIHAKNLEATTFLDKYKDDYIRKIKKNYYCEFCNVLLQTTAKVGLHVAKEKHTNNKGTQLLKRRGNSITAFNNIQISEKSWHGLVDDTCLLCNTEFDDEGIHKTESIHILNLVQIQVEFGADQSIYRKIDDSSFQCLTCNLVIASNTITSHFNGTEHKTVLQNCIFEIEPEEEDEPKNETVHKDVEVAQDKVEVKKENEPKETTKPELPVEPMKKPEPVAKKVEETPKKVVETPKKIVEIPKKEVIEAKKADRVKLEKATQELDEEICKALGAKDYISHDESGKKWCLLCDWTMDNLVINNHVTGRHHQTMLKMHKERLQNQVKSEYNGTENNAKSGKRDQNDVHDNVMKILDSVAKFQSNDINIDFFVNTAFCKKCSNHVDFNYKAVEAHIEEHQKVAQKEAAKTVNASQKGDDKKTKNKEEHRAESRASSVASSVPEQDEEIEKFAKANDLAYNRGANKVYCKICDSRIPCSLKNLKEHMSGMSHKTKAIKWAEHQKTKNVTVKTPMKHYIKNLSAVENSLIKDVIINEKFCINILSFMMVTFMGRLRCEPCEMYLTVEEVDIHKCSPNHERAMSETLVVVSDSEFIREVRPSVFHCGYCNTVSSEEDFQDHLATTTHREAKTAGTWRLQQYNAEITLVQQIQERQNVEMLALMRMLASGGVF